MTLPLHFFLKSLRDNDSVAHQAPISGIQGFFMKLLNRLSGYPFTSKLLTDSISCYLLTAERQGFEPWNQFYPVNFLAGSPFRPLRHLSNFALFKILYISSGVSDYSSQSLENILRHLFSPQSAHPTCFS